MENQQKTRIRMRMVEFEDYGEEEFLEYLALQEAEELELQMPKRTVLYRSGHRQFVAEYARMALLGGKLYDLGPGSWWWPPNIHEEDQFRFFVPIRDPAALAPLLVMARQFCNPSVATVYDYEAASLLEQYEEEWHPCQMYLVIATQFGMMGEREF